MEQRHPGAQKDKSAQADRRPSDRLPFWKKVEDSMDDSQWTSAPPVVLPGDVPPRSSASNRITALPAPTAPYSAT
jgi:hypothetical protein